MLSQCRVGKKTRLSIKSVTLAWSNLDGFSFVHTYRPPHIPTSSMGMQYILLASSLSLLPAFVKAYSFQLSNQPTQCGNTTVQIVGSGSPPYSLLLIPYGPPTTTSGVEVRKIQSLQFDSDTTTLNLKFLYPANSQFVAVVSNPFCTIISPSISYCRFPIKMDLPPVERVLRRLSPIALIRVALARHRLKQLSTIASSPVE